MNFKNLQDDFFIRYNTNSTPYCLFSGTPLYILGDLSFPDFGHSLITAISTGTALLTDFEGSDFSIQQTDDNTIFSCSKNNLDLYKEKNYATKIFQAIDCLNSYSPNPPKCARLLYHHNTKIKSFHNYLAPLISLYMLIYKESSPERILTALSPLKLLRKEYLSLLATLTLNKGHIKLSNNLSLSEKDYLFPIDGNKIIIIKTDAKPKKIFTDFSPTADPESLTKEQQKILSFFIKEEDLILKYPGISNFSEFYNLINESSEDLRSIIDSTELSILLEITEKTSALASRAILNSSSIYSIVPDCDIDDFIKYTEKEYEKKAGYKPTFYITDTINSGIKSEIIH